MKTLKSNLKSVRLTDEVFGYVNGFEGDGFNEKFENLVLFCMKTERERRETLRQLDRLIDEKQGILDSLRDIRAKADSMSLCSRMFEDRMTGLFREISAKMDRLQ